VFFFGEYRQKDWVDVISEDGLRMSVVCGSRVDSISEYLARSEFYKK
jgi:hypothetical protein